ncbi:MAG: hypothetical protein ACYCWW_10710 [Deltaproteobacteria bacterium]
MTAPRRPRGLQSLGATALAALLSCVGPVTSGYPPLVQGCKVAADCAFAGPAFVCQDGGCTPATCGCDDDCPKGTGCLLPASTIGECVGARPVTPCRSDGGGEGSTGAASSGGSSGSTGEGSGPSGGSSGGGTSGGSVAGCDAPSLVFGTTCAGCHNPTLLRGNLDLQSADVASRLVNIAPALCPTEADGGQLVYVTPGRPAGSYVMDKLLSATPYCGAQMPKGAAPLADGGIQCVARWISSLDGG